VTGWRLGGTSSAGAEPVHHVFVVCTLSVHYMSTVYLQCVHYVSTVCPLCMHCVSTVCLQCVHCVSTVCPLVCQLCVRYVSTVCPLCRRALHNTLMQKWGGNTDPGNTLLMLQEAARGLSLSPVLRCLLHRLQPLQLLINSLLPEHGRDTQQSACVVVLEKQLFSIPECLHSDRNAHPTVGI